MSVDRTSIIDASADRERRAPQQARSRETELRLLDATLALLSEGGLDACQIPEVAQRAGVSVGSVYRRFEDKNALLTAAFRHALNCQADARAPLRTQLAALPDVETVLRTLVTAFLMSLAAAEKFTLALHSFTRGSADAEFKAFVKDARRQSLAVMESVLREKAPAAVPTERIRFALIAVTATLQALLINDEAEALGWSTTDDRIIEHVTQMAIGHLAAPAV